MCVFLHISKEMLIKKLYLIVHVNKSRKRTIQSWISIPQNEPWYLFIMRLRKCRNVIGHIHYGDVIMSAMASQITSLTIVYSIVYSGADQRKHRSSASLAFVRGVHQWPVNSPHEGPVTRKMFPFDDVIMNLNHGNLKSSHWLQNWCQFWQHGSSHVKFGITYFHYYPICFTRLSVITGMVWLYMDEVK